MVLLFYTFGPFLWLFRSNCNVRPTLKNGRLQRCEASMLRSWDNASIGASVAGCSIHAIHGP